MQLSETVQPQVHDLLQIDPNGLDLSAPAPSWVSESLRAQAWVVVRRAEASVGHIAVGVRGNDRSERWGGIVPQSSVRKVVRPPELLVYVQDSSRALRTPAMKTLRRLIERWRELDLPWGPVGSVGFELATRCHVTSEKSDLDVAIRAPQRISVRRAQQMWDRVTGLEVKIDARVETPECGFSLEEYARSSAPILLRYPDAVGIRDDPWSIPAKAAGTSS
jgi:phosphoribosyl-dephospho-CoA transferase